MAAPNRRFTGSIGWATGAALGVAVRPVARIACLGADLGRFSLPPRNARILVERFYSPVRPPSGARTPAHQRHDRRGKSADVDSGGGHDDQEGCHPVPIRHQQRRVRSAVRRR